VRAEHASLGKKLGRVERGEANQRESSNKKGGGCATQSHAFAHLTRRGATNLERSNGGTRMGTGPGVMTLLTPWP
jgi:hypothetical protein